MGRTRSRCTSQRRNITSRLRRNRLTSFIACRVITCAYVCKPNNASRTSYTDSINLRNRKAWVNLRLRRKPTRFKSSSQSTRFWIVSSWKSSTSASKRKISPTTPRLSSRVQSCSRKTGLHNLLTVDCSARPSKQLPKTAQWRSIPPTRVDGSSLRSRGAKRLLFVPGTSHTPSATLETRLKALRKMSSVAKVARLIRRSREFRMEILCFSPTSLEVTLIWECIKVSARRAIRARFSRSHQSMVATPRCSLQASKLPVGVPILVCPTRARESGRLRRWITQSCSTKDQALEASAI